MNRRARIVLRLRERALLDQMRVAAFGDHECRPFAVALEQGHVLDSDDSRVQQ